MAKKRTNPTEARLDIRVKPETADILKATAKEAGVSMNSLMNCISVWVAANIKTGRPIIQHDNVVGSQKSEGMFWLGQIMDDEISPDGDVYAVFDFSTHRAIRNPKEFYYSEENPHE